ncbi:MAG: hypothetical protein ACRDK9_00730 [Solirubrobacterales bacterium]
MTIPIEPLDGHHLDRLITVLLNATGVVHRLIGDTERPADADGEQIIDLCAERVRGMLPLLVEHHGDEELAVAAQVLATATLLIAAELELDWPTDSH